MTQAKVVLAALKQGPMTPIDAFKNHGITRLASCVFDLREQGFCIHTEHVKTFNRLGGNATYARYHLQRSKSFVTV